jgi:hypothetical protein
MADEHSQGHINPKIIPKKKENIRIFVHRKRLHKSNPLQTNKMKHLTSIIEKNLNLNKKNSRNNKNVIVVNYKPVFVTSRQQKPIPTNDNSSSIPPNKPKSNNSSSFDVPDVEDPFVFIEMMYQQLFTEDGKLRSGDEPTVLANCVKQIVTQSRRNSISQRKRSSTTLSSRFARNIFDEEGESNSLFQRNRTANTSRR